VMRVAMIAGLTASCVDCSSGGSRGGAFVPFSALFEGVGLMAEKDSETIETAEPVPVDELIERWWADHFPGSAIARDTQAWNVAHAAKEVLKRLLRGSV
jgi:hypothetical protein